MYAWLCPDLACVSNSQSSYVVVEKWLHCVIQLHDKLFSAKMTMLFRVTVQTSFYLYSMHSLCAVIWYFTENLSYITVQCHSALLVHARPTMFYIPLVVVVYQVVRASMHILGSGLPTPKYHWCRNNSWSTT